MFHMWSSFYPILLIFFFSNELTKLLPGIYITEQKNYKNKQTNMQDIRSRGKLILKRRCLGFKKCSDKAGQNLKSLQQFNLCSPSCAGLAINFEKLVND